MGDILKLALRLFIFALVAAALLGVTNEVTKGPIAEQKMAAQKVALNKVLPGLAHEEASYESLPETTNLDQIFVGKDASGEIKGYALTASPNGYGGEIPITVGVDTEGWVTQVFVGALQETAGLGSRVGEDEFQSQFIGVPASADTLSDSVSTLSGATISSSAFIGAVKEALTYTEGTLGIAPNAGDPDAIIAAYKAANGGDEPAEPVVTTASYDVKGFADFKVEISTDETGKIVSVSVPEHNETPGFGADLIADTAVFDALVGQDIATAQIDVKAGATLTSNAINDALKQAGAPAGGAAAYAVKGFGDFNVEIAVDDAGKIVSVAIPEHNETPGFGADLIADTAVFDALVGQDIATAQIDVKAGATLTSNAINDALKQAAKAAGGESAPAIPGDPFTVKGMNKFTLYVEAENGKIVSVSAPEHNETPGFGADMLTEEALAALAGQDLATAQVDVKAGVTLTSNAINSALAQAAAANGIEVVKAEEEAAPVVEAPSAVEAVTYEVKGIAPFTMDIAVDENGKIASVHAKHNETPGFGADMLTEEALSALVGQDIATAQIDVKAGVTLTSNAINDALAQAGAAAPAEEAAPAVEAVTYEVKGIAPFTMDIAVDENGKIASVSAAHNETPGFGADMLTEEALSALVGQDIATAQIDVKAGVTLTSNAINDALAQAGAAAPAEEAAPAVEAVTYEVKGIAPFTMDIAVDENGKIASVSAAHNETPGFGADMLTEEALSALVGQDIATAQIDVKAGVTLTSNAINDALAQAGAGAPAEEAAPAVEAVTYEVKGIAPFTMDIAVDENGKIASVSAAHNETPGFGADMLTEEALSALVGQDIATAQIDVKAGVTLTSNAINEALAQAGAAAPAEEAAPAVEAVTYEVKGIAPFTMDIAVDENGKIASVSAAHNETPGFGADMLTEEALSALVGQDIATAQIDVKAGVTLTSNAINEALAQAGAAAPAVEAPVEEATPVEEPAAVAAKTYEAQIMGMNAKHTITLCIGVDENGTIVSATCPAHSEDEGYGADILTDEALGALKGQKLAEAAFDTKAGATVTSGAINEALKLIARAAAPAPAEEAAAEEAPAEEAPAAEAAKLYEVQVKGMNAKHTITLCVGVDENGTIVSATCPAHNEDEGFGADLLTDEALGALKGQKLAEAAFDTKAGATVTSGAINEALKLIAGAAAKEVQ